MIKRVFLLYIVLVGLLASCSENPSNENTSSINETSYKKIHLCDLDETLVGEAVRVEGRITYLDKTDSGSEIYFDIDQASCQAGVWLDKKAVKSLSGELLDLLVMDGDIAVSGTLEIMDGENFIDFESLEKPTELVANTLDQTEQWWLKPQTYHNGEGPDLDLIPSMNITVLHDWGALTAGFATNADSYWGEDAIRERWERAHAKGMRVEAVLSILDMWFVEYGPEDEVYDSSGINLYGEHIAYQDPVGFVGCTNQHGWREFTKEKIFKAIDWGADGIVIDDYEGSSRWTSGVPNGMGGKENGPGACFCSACEAGFRDYLKNKYSSEELVNMEINDINTFDYSDFLLEKRWTIEQLGEESRKFQFWDSDAEIIVPLYQDYADFQNQEIIEFLKELREEAIAYAKDTYGREISWSENAGELTYGAHKSYPLFDRNIGAIWQFGYPPKGSDGYHFRLDYSIFGNPRLRAQFTDPVVVGVMNEYQTQNLWLIKSAEAYANLGALIEYDYIALEGASDEVAHASLTNDATAKHHYNTFYLDHSYLFDFTALESMAKTAVLYSSPSVHYDMNRHITSFNGICEILTDLNVQFDPLFIGDGISYPDTISIENLAKYDLVFLPNVYALTDHQAQTLLEYMNKGGNVIALGDFAVVDEINLAFTNSDIKSLLEKREETVGLGSFTQLRSEEIRFDDIVENYFKDTAALYFDNYIENNHPAIEPFLYEYDQGRARLSDDAASEIRNEIIGYVDKALDKRVVDTVSVENIAAQLYVNNDTDQIIMHLLNYNYELETDSMIRQEDIVLKIFLPEDFEPIKATLFLPDFVGQEELDFTLENGLLELIVPEIYIWDVLVIE